MQTAGLSNAAAVQIDSPLKKKKKETHEERHKAFQNVLCSSLCKAS